MQCALAYGLAGILVDFPRMDGVQTLADQRNRGARPYFVLIDPGQIVGFRTVRDGAMWRLSQLRLREHVSEPDGDHGEQVLDLGEELALGDGRREGVGVPRVEQALEHDPPVGDVAVLGGVDPAEAAVRDRTGDDVLAADDVAGLQLGGERERVAARRAEALGASRLAVAGATHR